MAHILFLTPQLPYPPQQGTTLRNFNIIRGISSAHDLALLSYVSAEDTNLDNSFEVLGTFCYKIDYCPNRKRSNLRRLYQLISSRRPDMANRLYSGDFAMALSSFIKEAKSNHLPIEIVQIEGIEMASAIPIIRNIDPEIKIIFDNHNAEAALQRRAYETDRVQPKRWPLAAYSYIQTKRLQRYEQWACESADYVVSVSDQDLNQIKLIAPDIRSEVIHNSINVEEYAFLPKSSESKFDLVFIGKMDYRPNVDAVLWFGENVWPIVYANRPMTTWAVVGKKPHPRLEGLRGLEGVNVTGTVDSTLPFLEGAKIVILPFRIGSGTRLKFIEAMAAGKAVVSTQLGAEGFNIHAEEEVIIANDAVDFAKAILTLIDNPEERERLGRNAQQYSKDFDFKLVNKKFDAIYHELTANHP